MSDRDMDRLTAALRRWAERPPSLSPRAAKTRVLAHLPSHRRRTAWRLLAGGGALIATVAALALLVGRQSEPVAVPTTTTASAQRVIVHQLSSGTKLYIVMRPSAAEGES